VPGHETFLKPPTPEELIAASAAGPIAVINVSPLRSDALVVRPSGIAVVPLPGLTPEAIESIGGSILTAADRPDEPGSHETILSGLEWLWDHLAEPVLDVAAPARADGVTPRLWWCPTGPLSFLPLHAAGRHRYGYDQTVMARVASSYTPTIRALRRARALNTTARAEANLLAVAVTHTPHSPDSLPSAKPEAEMIGQTHPATTVLADAQATVGAVRAGLPHYRRAHFACHGRLDTESPARSSLLLHDRDDVLTAGDISRLDMSSAELAYLSVCDTARPDPANADEALHIAGAFLVAGYPNVIGTLWRVPDATGRRLARAFYRYLAEGDYPAGALHKAVTDLYRLAPGKPGLWANMVHFGA
jgi:CHAT domain-containing protein